MPGTAHAVTGLPPVVYFKFDDESKQLVPWRSEVRKVS